FIETHPELFDFKPRLDRANKVLDYLSQIAVNGFPDIDPGVPGRGAKPARFQTPRVPLVPKSTPPVSPAFAVFKAHGPAGLAKWLTQQKALLLTDTTFRDAHQSLIATRMRS